MVSKIDIDGVRLTLAAPDTHEVHWIDYNDYLRQLGAAWLRLSDGDLPLNPRIVGEPGIGKTTFAAQQHGEVVVGCTSSNARWTHGLKI